MSKLNANVNVEINLGLYSEISRNAHQLRSVH